MAKSPRSPGIKGGKFFPAKIFGKASVALHGTRFVAGVAIGLPSRPRPVPGAVTTFRAAGRELGRCDVGRRTSSTTAGPEIIKNIVALMLVTPSTPAPGPGRKPH